MTRAEYHEKLLLRKKLYCDFFSSDKANAILEDLAEFCRANTTTFHADPRIHAVLEGRREIWLRIQDHLRLTPEDFLKQYAPVKPHEMETDK